MSEADEDLPTCVFCNTCIGHDGPGIYYWDEEYPDEGAIGAFATIAEAVASAREGGYNVPDEPEVMPDPDEDLSAEVKVAAGALAKMCGRSEDLMHGYEEGMRRVLKVLTKLDREHTKTKKKLEALSEHVMGAAPLAWCAGGAGSMEDAADWEKRACVLLGIEKSAVENP